MMVRKHILGLRVRQPTGHLMPTLAAESTPRGVMFVVGKIVVAPIEPRPRPPTASRKATKG